ncbi:hypothetical protein [Streptomyces sp. NPDC051567]|uniref:hypothetical protein n=1 Tax=Streptomyces sp. NPDC051567 TaxID=3365660 RepID=UPI003790850C
MRSALIALRTTGVAVALTAFSVVTAPTALANEDFRGGSVSVEPSPAHPGAHVKLRVHGCHGNRGVARSPVFTHEVELSGHDGGRHDGGRGDGGRGDGGRGDGGRGPLFGEARIASHAQPGWHTVRVACDGRDDKISGSVEIAHHRPGHHPSPFWPVHAGGGGMSAEVAETTRLAAATKKSPEGEGPGVPHTVIAAALAATAALAVAGRALVLRRRRSGR